MSAITSIPQQKSGEPIQSPKDSIIVSIRSHETALRTVDARDATDEQLLNEIGYKQELRRTFSTFQIFGIAYSIMGLLPSISSVAYLGYSAGPGGFLWGWFVASIFILSIGVSMSTLASSMPTSGGLYYWSYYYAPEGWRAPISFVIGTSNSLALCAGFVSIAYGNAQEILAAVYLTQDGDFTITRGNTYGVFAACIIGQAILAGASSKKVAWLQTVSAVSNTALIVLFLIALPIGTKHNGSFNGGKFIFGEIDNFSAWPTGFQFILSMMTAVWTIGAFDSCVHMSEECRNASYGCPIGIIGSISVCGMLGFFIIICMNACITTDIEAILNSETGFPVAQIVYNALGRNWAIAVMALMAVCQFLMGASISTALSRQVWAFARDNGLPLSFFIKVVDKKLKVPLRAVIASGCFGLVLGCLCLAGTTASSALFTLAVAGNYLAWCTPILLSLTSGSNRFVPGHFYLGNTAWKINGWISVLWGAFIIIISMFPSSTTVTASDMNYTCVIAGGVWLLSTIYYFVYKYKYYHGPQSNLDPEEQLEVDEVLATKSRMSIPEKVG